MTAPEHGPVYLYSYACKDSAGRLKIDSAVTRQHPLLKIKEWHERYPDETFTVISYQVVEQIGNVELQRYLDYSINENHGELA